MRNWHNLIIEVKLIAISFIESAALSVGAIAITGELIHIGWMLLGAVLVFFLNKGLNWAWNKLAKDGKNQ